MVKVLFVTDKVYEDKEKNKTIEYSELILSDDVAKSVGKAKVYKDENFVAFFPGEEVSLIGYLKYDGSLGVRVEHIIKSK